MNWIAVKDKKPEEGVIYLCKNSKCVRDIDTITAPQSGGKTIYCTKALFDVTHYVNKADLLAALEEVENG